MAKANSKPDEDGQTPEAQETKPAKVKAAKPEREYYEEWNCQIKGGKAEKMKMKRARVLISDEQAAILNEGRIHGGNSYALLYFKPEGK